jgi:adenylate kinase family enzyme
MSNAILIIGESGSGKSTAVRALPPEKTFIVNCIGKPLPFQGWKGKYQPLGEDGKGNYLATDNTVTIVKTLGFISEKRPDIEYVVIDDYIYTMVNEFMRRANEKTYDKFTDIGQKAWMLADKAKSLRDNLNVAILTHVEDNMDATGVKKQKAKTVGKLVDNIVNLEGMFTVVLYTDVEEKDGKNEYGFLTQTDGRNTCKSPDGMFKDKKIPNDLKVVFDQIEKYYFN